MNVLLLPIDGTYPNLALMKLAAHHIARGDEVWLNAHPQPDLVYASSIFTFSENERARAAMDYPGAQTGGTGYDLHVKLPPDIEALHPDYSLYPDFTACIGFTSRGCRNRCPFCVVPAKEGSCHAVAKLSDIWQEGRPRDLILLDNDFFGSDKWRDRLIEARDGGYRLNFNQGINCRSLTEEQARALAAAPYYNARFTKRRIHTAWDRLRDERAVRRGLARMLGAGIPPHRIVVYMLIGFEGGETLDEIEYRRLEVAALGCHPYPMLYDRSREDLKRYQRWVIRRYCEFMPFSEYHHAPVPTMPLFTDH